MIDDKAIEAALDAWNALVDHPSGDAVAMRAALAAADKVRAEGFDPIEIGRRSYCAHTDDLLDEIQQGLRDAFAAGLAKGESSARDEFVKDLRKMADRAEKHDISYPIIHRRNLVAIALDRAADVLSLVRKGV